MDLLKELPPPLGVGSEGSYYNCQILAKKVRKNTPSYLLDCSCLGEVFVGNVEHVSSCLSSYNVTSAYQFFAIAVPGKGG